MRCSLVHLSLRAIRDRQFHRAYNEWRDLVLHPQLLARPEIAWGETWVRSPSCLGAGATGAGEFDDAQYLSAYWFRSPAAIARRVHAAESERLFQSGQRRDLTTTRQLLDAFMVPIKGYASPHALVSPDALPFRPNRGVHLTLSRFTRHDAEAERVFHWHDAVRIPDLLRCRGVAGVWVLTSDDLFRADRDVARPCLRAQLVFLDDRPASFAEDLSAREAGLRRGSAWRDTSAVEQVLFSGPLEAITAWRWDWFD